MPLPRILLSLWLLAALPVSVFPGKLTGSPFAKELAPVTDLWLDLCYGPHDEATIQAKMEVFAALGFERAYFIAMTPGLPAYGSRFLDTIPNPERYGHYGLQSFEQLGDPNRVMIEAIQRNGMQPFAVFKPYESGTGRTVPFGETHQVRPKGLPDVGGIAFGFDAFTLQNPQMRLLRRPDPEGAAQARQPVERIEVTLLAGSIERAPDGQLSTADAEEIAEKMHLFVSDTNGIYERLNRKDFTLDFRMEERVLRDAENVPLEGEGVRHTVAVFSFSGLNLGPETPFIAATWQQAGHEGRLVPASMVSLFSASGEIPSTATTKVRQGLTPLEGKRTWGSFSKDGFEFNEYGWGRMHPGWEETKVVGIARGKNEYLKGILCEAYPEVRAYWMEQIETLLDQGAKGIDIRFVGHSAMDVDYASYGYNPPVIEAFKAKHGRVPDGGMEDFKRLMRVRGEIFEGFLKEVKELTESHDALLKIHFQSAYLNLESRGAFRGMVQWGMPKLFLDWRTLLEIADEVTLKDHFRGDYNPRRAQPLKVAAKELGKPVWVHCYLTQGTDFKPAFFEAAAKDDLIDGVLLYETVKRKNPNWGGVARPGIVGAAPDGGLYLDGTSIELIRKLQGDKADAATLQSKVRQHEDLRPAR